MTRSEVVSLVEEESAEETVERLKQRLEDVLWENSVSINRLMSTEGRLRAEAENRLRIEQERADLQCELAHAHKLESIGQLAAGIAHEINTPAQYVGDNAQFLKESFAEIGPLLEKAGALVEAVQKDEGFRGLAQELGEELEEADVEYLADEIPVCIEQSQGGIDRIRKIVQSMKEFSHPGSKEMEPVDLNRALSSTITVASNEWKYVADLETDLDPGLPPTPCLPGEINQVLLNLLVNASHAIGDVVGDGAEGKGRIRVSTRRDGEWVEIRIADSGSGIPEGVREKVFDPFFTTKEVGKGTGQGLSMAYRTIVKDHGGELRFETEVGEGTTFIIRLPIHREDEESEAAA